MHTLLVRFFLSVLLLTATRGVYSQNVVIDYYNSTDGLSNNYVFDVLRDQNGFVWCSTHGGLNRFDGVTFTHFFNDPKSENSPLANRGSRVYADRNGNIWWVTLASGLNRYNPVTHTFKRFPNPIPGSGSNDKVGYAFAENKNGTLFMLSEQGLCYYNPIEEKISLYRVANNDSIWLPRANVIFFDSHDQMYIAAQGGVYFIDLNTGSKQLLPGTELFDADSYGIVEDSRGHFFIATWGGGMLDYNPVTKTYTRYFGQHESFKSNLTIYLDVDIVERNGQEFIIYCTNTYLLQELDPRTGNIISYDLREALNDDDQSVICTSVEVDQQNNIWISTSQGLMLINPLRQLFKQVPVAEFIREDWYTSVSALYQDPADKTGNTLWYVMPQYGLIKSDLTTGEHKQIRLGAISTKDVFISQIIRQNDSTLLMAGNSGFIRYNDITGQVTQYLYNKEDPTSLSGNFTSRITIDEFGNVWIGTHGHGINLYKPSCDCFERITIADQKIYNVYLSDNINDMAADGKGNLWIARGYMTGYVSGVSRLNIRSHDQTHFFKNVNTFKDFPLERDIFTCLPDQDGYLWIGSEQGVVRFDPDATDKDSRYVVFSQSNRLISDIVYGLSDYNGYMWVSGDNGISIIDKKKLEIVRRYGKNDGLASDHPSVTEVGLNGRFWIGGKMSIQYVSMDLVQPNKTPPPVFITSFKIFDKEYFKNGKSVLAIDKVKLKHDQNTLTFEFTALNFTNAASNQFAYMLEGVDEDWVYTTNRFVRYNKLRKGDYVFRVKASNDNNIWNETGDSITITIIPPWYNTIVFYCACVLAGAGLLYALYRFRLAQVIRIERLRNKISADLHDDIGSSLSSINMLSSLGKNEVPLDGEQSQRILNRIHVTTRQTMDNMADIVWAINPKNDTIGDFRTRMRQYLSDTLETQNIQYTFQVQEKLLTNKLSMEFRRDLYLIFKEAVNNAAKYAQANVIAIELKEVDGLLILNVEDNGTGFNPQTVIRGNGLSNMQSRAQTLGGNLQIESAPGKGCVVRLSVPLH